MTGEGGGKSLDEMQGEKPAEKCSDIYSALHVEQKTGLVDKPTINERSDQGGRKSERKKKREEEDR